MVPTIKLSDDLLIERDTRCWVLKHREDRIKEDGTTENKWRETFHSKVVDAARYALNHYVIPSGNTTGLHLYIEQLQSAATNFERAIAAAAENIESVGRKDPQDND